MMPESVIYQDILQEGLEQGIEEGLEELFYFWLRKGDRGLFVTSILTRRSLLLIRFPT